MTTGQKCIKYCAIGIATSLAFGIISSLFAGLVLFADVLGLKINDDKIEEVKIVDTTFDNLDIDLASTKLEIQVGHNFKVETNSEYIDTNVKNNTLQVKEKSKIFSNFKGKKVIIYIPENFKLNNVSIDSGAGNLNIEDLTSETLSLDIGAGNVDVSGLNVLSKAKISGGAGSIIMNDVNINNIDLEVGVGRCQISGIFNGNNDIESGVGQLDLNLLNSLDDYKLYLEKGIGNIKLNNEKITNSTIGNGVNTINIEAGIGNIHITTIN